MNFSELKDKQGDVTIEVLIIRVDPVTDVVDKRGKKRQVVHCLVWDSENNPGYLTLWDKEIPLAKRDTKLKVVGGYHWLYTDKEGIVWHNLSSGLKGIVRKAG